MMQISKTIASINDFRKKAESLAKDGFHQESDDYIIEAYISAADLIETYEESYFTDSELEFLQTILEEFESQ
jgi:5-formaminoimidazole-4-carboxamide-1-beta-D-ribofuranosyl 5'-monophosphate synthetase